MCTNQRQSQHHCPVAADDMFNNELRTAAPACYTLPYIYIALLRDRRSDLARAAGAGPGTPSSSPRCNVAGAAPPPPLLLPAGHRAARAGARAFGRRSDYDEDVM